jgi:hypothetical protein
MEVQMSIQTKKELLLHTKRRYVVANLKNKRKILDEFVSITNYSRKYAIHLFNKKDQTELHASKNIAKKKRNIRKRKYDESLKAALLTIWYAANQICSKRLVPFIPDLLVVLERFGYIALSENIRKKLLQISPATVDRLLETQRLENRGGISTTRPGSLLKKQIKIRTFADWNDVIPGFLEGDLVAHCGDRTDGVFLNTLVLTDIASSWTEFFPLLKKSSENVIASLEILQQILPFMLLGLDTDNGSEFINYALLDFCRRHEITFTRSRAYKKNDQAHVEEKNGSIVRRVIGYDRFEGIDAYNALSELYAILRLYINFFQPSLKLISKKRDGAKVTKKYDKAKTPYQRLLTSTSVPESVKTKLRIQYETLDPVLLLKNLQKLQNNFWKHAWKKQTQNITSNINASSFVKEKVFKQSHELDPGEVITQTTNTVNIKVANIEILKNNPSQKNNRIYRHTKKPRKQLAPRTWRTRADPFENVWDKKIRIQLELNPACTATSLLNNLIKADPEKFNTGNLRALQRKLAQWRKEQIKMKQKQYLPDSSILADEIKKYISLVAHSVTNG